MRPMTGLLGLLALTWLSAGVARAQDAETKERMDRFERRLNEMEEKHRAELKARDEEIARLRYLIEQQGVTAPAAPTTRPAGSDAARQAILRELDEPTGPTTMQARRGPLASLNPDIAVIADFLGTISDNRRNDAWNRLDIREVELDLRAAVHPRADGVLVLAFERDVENPVFPGDEPPEGPESSVSVEEAYLLIHDTGVKNLTAKIGRFHVRFGRQNMLHLHDLPTSDPPLVNQAFLSPEALTDAGVSLSWLVPNPWGQYVEAIVEVISGEGEASESPTLQGDLTVDSPALNAHLLWNTDLASNLNFELGGSWLMGHADADNARDVMLYGLDATLLRRDPRGGFNNRLIQGELIYGEVDQDAGDTTHSLGAYLLAQQQLNRDLYVGLRLDWTEDANDDDLEAYALSPYVTWNWTEFLRFRAQYQYRDGDAGEDEHVLYLQATWMFGSHPPHPYWSAK